MKVYFATTNRNKIKELQAIARLAGANCEIQPMPFHGTEPEENGSTFKENAKIKFNFYEKHFNNAGILATEDSGIEIHCLKNGFPSIHSARYMQEFPNKQTCFEDLKTKIGKNESSASFVCNICTKINGKIFHFEEKCHGKISFNFPQEDSFGFDSIFIPEGQTQTFTQLKEEVKHSLSHRGKTFTQFLNFAI
jgi:XTP/dITP diphosphohydrolase